MIPIIAGWGKDAKVIAYLGIRKCPNCRNCDHWQLYEVQKKVTAFFIPVAKWGSKYYMVCNVCQASYEIDAAQKEQLLRESLEIPPLETVVACWEALDNTVLQAAEGPGDDPAKLLEDADNALLMAAEQLENHYPKPHVEYVCAVYAASLLDDDKPMDEVDLVPPQRIPEVSSPTPPQSPDAGTSAAEVPVEATAEHPVQSVSQVQPAQSAHVGPVKRRSHAGSWVVAIIVLLAVVAGIAYFAGSQSPPGTWADAQEAYGRGDLARAERVLQYLQNKTPTDANDAIHPREFAHAYCDIGDTYRQRGQYLAAIAAYQEAIAIMPANPDAHFGLASCYEHQDRLNEAITAYREAIAIQPEFAPAHCGLGFCYGRQERYSEAVSAYLQAIAIQPGYAHAYVLLGYAYSAQMREGEAIAAFERAIRLEHCA
jgi:tetratricopeptide (TPR) repeat protein